MHTYTLRVIEDGLGYLIPDTRCSEGGEDMLQHLAFCHLFPCGKVSWGFHDTLYEMAQIHGWEVVVTVEK